MFYVAHGSSQGKGVISKRCTKIYIWLQESGSGDSYDGKEGGEADLLVLSQSVTPLGLMKQMLQIKTRGTQATPVISSFQMTEPASSTHKQKAKSPQSLHPTKRKASLQIRLAMKKRKRLQIVLLLSSDSSSEERLPRTITARNSSRPDEVNVVDRHKVCGNATELFVSDDEQAPSTHKCEKKPQGSSRPMKQLASLLEMDSAQPSSPKVMKGSPQTRPAIKKPRLRSISPLSSELSSEEEVETHPSGDQLNVTSPRVSVEHQQSSGELCVEQYPVTTNIQTSLHESLHAMKSLSRVQENQRLPSGPYQEPPRLEAPLQVTPPHILGGKPIAGDPSHEPTRNQLPVAPHQKPCYTEMMECDLAVGGQKGRGVPSQVPRHDELVHLQHTQESAQHDQVCSVPLEDVRSMKPMECAAAPHETAYESWREWPDVTVSLPVVDPMESGRSLEKMPNASPSSRLVAAEEGYVGSSSGDGEMATDSPAAMISLAMKGFPTLSGINSRWYDPSARGSDVCYGPYHPQYILPPPFATHCYLGYANNPIIHWQPPTRGPAHYTNVPLPFHSMHNADYANPSGGHELPAGPYRHAEVYGLKQPDAAAFPDTRGGTEHSMGTAVTSLGVTPDPSDLAGNIPSTSDV
ncbi:hypothetical protein EDC04DRAFT_2608352 [Pisolithus marmoratus]|nr:hypothetical protein EDC04DRAFT_2608352 [Pisolithus marmoratus]